MSLVFDTASMAPGERFDGWQDAAARCFFPMAIRRRTIEPFSGRMVGHELPSIDVVRVAATPNDCVRTPRGIAARDPEQLQLHILRRGRCEVTQDDRGDVLSAGAMTTLDSSRPWAIRAVEPFELLVLAVPKALLRPFADTLSAGTARAIPGDVGLGSLIVPFAFGLADRLEDRSIGEGRDELGETLLGCCARWPWTARASAARRPPPRCCRRSRRTSSATSATPRSGPARSPPRTSSRRATCIGCSATRAARSRSGSAARAWSAAGAISPIRRSRGRRSSPIATRWGMPDAAHFSRVFRAAYGCSPREFRTSSPDSAARDLTARARLTIRRV